MGELKVEYEGRIEFTIVSARTPEAQEEVLDLEIGSNHGLVGFNRKGEPELTMPSHNYTKEDIKDELDELLKSDGR